MFVKMDLEHFFVEFCKCILNQRLQKKIKITFDNVLKNLTQYPYHMEEMKKRGISTCT